jgi:CheY-like chemotaxis protein
MGMFYFSDVLSGSCKLIDRFDENLFALVGFVQEYKVTGGCRASSHFSLEKDKLKFDPCREIPGKFGIPIAYSKYQIGIMAKKPKSKPKIYIADDDLDDQELLLSAFQQLTDSHHLTVVNNGTELLNLLSLTDDEGLPCLIVLDYNMPGLNGKQVLTRLQNAPRYRQIPKVIYTTSNSFLDSREFLSIGARDFITKSSSMKDIVGAAKKMLSYCYNGVMQSA